MKLYEIKQNYLELLTRFRQAEDEQELGEIADALADINETLEEKLDNCARVYRTLEAEAEVYKQESNRLRGKANILENRAERLKDYIGLNLGQGNKISTSLFDFSWRKSEQVVIDSELLVPDQYKRVTTISEPNKILLKQDIKMGAEVPGARLISNYSLQIK